MKSRWPGLVTTAGMLALLAAAGRLAGEDAPPADPELAEVQRQCDERVKALGAFYQDTENSVLKSMEERLNAVEEEAKKEPALATAATGVPAVQVIEEAKAARDSVRLQVEMGKTLRAEAAQTFALAVKEKDPVRKVEAVKKGVALMIRSEEAARHVAAEFRQNSRSHAFNAEALNRLDKMAKTLANANPDSGVAALNRSWDGAVQRSGEPVPGRNNTPLFGIPSAAADGTLTMPTGQKINIAPLERAAASGQPAQTRAPLFRASPPAPTGSSYMTVDPAVRNRALSAAADPKVGGVALQVTVLALAVAGVPGFTQDGALEGVDQTVAFSLKRLLTRVQPAAADPQRWAALPDELRFPGGIERVLGFVLDRERGDVVLIGQPATRPEARMDLDTIILGLRASWRDKALVCVSLDASPLSPFGPQLSRVEGVPADSVAAKLMLDADYMMKEIMLGQRPTGVASYRTAVQLRKSDPNVLSQPWHARFWFYPKPIYPSVAGSGRTALFNAELQVLTEQMTAQGGIRVGTGTAGGVETTAAIEFTRELDTFAGSAKVDPQANFARLRGLTGVITLGTLLHKAGVDYPVLRDFIGLPCRRLTGAEAVWKQYPGLVTQFDVPGQKGFIRVSIGGGVELMPRQRRNSTESGVELLAASLERTVDRGDLLDRDSARESIPLVFSRVDAQTFGVGGDALMVEGTTAFARGQYDAAARHFRAAAAADPTAVDAYINLAFSLDRLGRGKEARAAIQTARLLDPDDSVAQLIEFAIRFRSEHSRMGQANPAKQLKELVNLYTANARHALHRGNADQAYTWANDAIEFGRPRPAVEAHLIRGYARLDKDPEKARKDIHLAWDETQYVLNGGAFDDDEKIHAHACLGLVECSIRLMSRAMKKGEAGPALFRSLAADMQESIKVMGPVQKLFPALSSVFTATLHIEVERYFLLKLEFTPEGQRGEAARLAAFGREILQRFPDSADAYSSTAELYMMLENPERAAAICSHWLTEHPLDTDCLTLRATAFALQDKCAEARQDLSVARKDPQFKGLPPGFRSACGNL